MNTFVVNFSRNFSVVEKLPDQLNRLTLGLIRNKYDSEKPDRLVLQSRATW